MRPRGHWRLPLQECFSEWFDKKAGAGCCYCLAGAIHFDSPVTSKIQNIKLSLLPLLRLFNERHFVNPYYRDDIRFWCKQFFPELFKAKQSLFYSLHKVIEFLDNFGWVEILKMQEFFVFLRSSPLHNSLLPIFSNLVLSHSKYEILGIYIYC